MSKLLIIDGFSVFGLNIKFYGLLIAIGFALGVIFVSKLAPKKGFDSGIAFDLVLIVFPSAIIGARIGYVLFHLENYPTFVSMLKVWEGGLMIYGGVLFSAITLLIYCKVKKYNFFKVCDLIVPALILGQALGRWGNFFNQEAYGSLVTNTNLQWFPFSVWIENGHFTDEAKIQLVNAYGTSDVTGAWFNATFFYESFWCLIGFVLLFLLSKKTDKIGVLTAVYFAYYGIERFFVEMLRTDSLYLGPIKISVLLSGIFVLAGATYLIYLFIISKKQNFAVDKVGKSVETKKENQIQK